MNTLHLQKLNRFTTITHMLELLKHQDLKLVNPDLWEDHNDKATMDLYRKIAKKESIYALCLTDQNETVHHWNAFANGATGCCIEFSPTKLFSALKASSEITHGKAQYVRIKDLPVHKIKAAQLPFLKRDPYKNENEYRLIAVSDRAQEKLFSVPVPVSAIRRITINNKISRADFELVKRQILALHPHLKVYQSTLYRNLTWIKHFSKLLNE